MARGSANRRSLLSRLDLLKLEIRRPERVAGRDRAAPIAGHEPALALVRAAVGEAVRHHPPGRFALQGVVANGGSCLHRSFDITGFDERRLALALQTLVLVFRPDAGQAIGLQLYPDLEAVPARAIHALLLPLHLGKDRSEERRVG